LKVTFPHMGTFAIPMKAFLEEAGLEVIPPPPTSKRTLTLGSRHAPEFACLPLKINLGNYLEALEAGADTIIMAGGVGPCRFGYYGEVQREILSAAGHDCRFMIFEPPGGDLQSLLARGRELFSGIKAKALLRAGWIAWAKFQAVDRLWQASLWARPREEIPGSTSRLLQQLLFSVDQASQVRQVRKIVRDGKAQFRSLAVRQPRICLAIVGEIYVVLDPFTNQQIEERLGHMGVEVHRTIYLSQWILRHLLLDVFHIHPQGTSRRLAQGYLNHKVGGHGLETVANTVLAARRGFHGVIQLAPFTCMPEIVAASILPSVSAQENIPVLTVVLDEHTGEAGLVTRLEAFVDMLIRQKRQGRQEHGLLSWA
jgi:predicted nucleotide-binding protein (sugar kinase/HSP70/actin superfamily)